MASPNTPEPSMEDLQARREALDYAIRMGAGVNAIEVAGQVLAFLGPKTAASQQTSVQGKRGSRWTAERLAFVKEHYPANMPIADMIAALNAMPGSTITSHILRGYVARSLGLRRTSGLTAVEAMHAAKAAKRAASTGTASH